MGSLKAATLMEQEEIFLSNLYRTFVTRLEDQHQRDISLNLTAFTRLMINKNLKCFTLINLNPMKIRIQTSQKSNSNILFYFFFMG